MGERTSVLDMTWIRKMSAIERLIVDRRVPANK